MSEIATVATITRYLQEGTGDPGLKFDLDDEATILELQDTEDYATWAVWPVDVFNSVDGWHPECVVLVNIQPGGVFRFLAMDPEGQPVAYHETEE